MRRSTLVLVGCGSLLALTAATAQDMSGLDAAAIEKKANEGRAALSDFVDRILSRGAKDDANAQAVADAANRSFENAPKSLRESNVGGADLAGAFGDGVGDDSDPEPTLIAFASTSMPTDSLKRMIEDVSKAGGVVVFRGVRADGSKTFMAMVQKAVGEGGDASSVVIDPRLFRAFGVQEVPTYVVSSRAFELCDGLDCVSQPAPFDRISGNVTARYALETFAEGGGPGAAKSRAALRSLVRD